MFVSCRSTQEECPTNITTDSEVQHIVRFMEGAKDREADAKEGRKRANVENSRSYNLKQLNLK